jgi:hypothetical protein
VTITRRDVLRRISFGVGGALFAPFFAQIARAQGSPPRRFVLVVEGNGVEPINFLSHAARARIEETSSSPIGDDRWFNRKYRHDTPQLVVDPQFQGALSLGPLEGGDGELDLRGRAAVVLGLSSKVTGGGHSTNAGALSCTRSSSENPGGQTIDALLAGIPAVRGEAPFDALRLGISSRPHTRQIYTLCAQAKGRPASVIVDPAVGYEYVFGSVASDAGRANFTRRGRLLDYATEDVNRALAVFPGSSRERAKLEQYLEALEEAAGRRDILTSLAEVLDGVRPAGPEDNPLYDSGSLDALRAQFDVATAALIGGLTHVVVMGSGTGSDGFNVRYSSINSEIPRHDIHHGSAGNSALQAQIHAVTEAHVGMVAKMARALAATPEVGAEGSMLDHTAILYMSDNGEQHHSTAEEWPALLVGGNALGLATDGRTVVYPGHGQDNNRQVSNLFNTLGHAAGVDLNDFGAEGALRIAEGELTELTS